MKQVFILIVTFFTLVACTPQQDINLKFTNEKLIVEAGHAEFLPLYLDGIEFSDIEFIYEGNAFSIIDDIVVGNNIGTATLTARSITFPNISDTIVIEVIPELPWFSTVTDVIVVGSSVRIDVLNYLREDFLWSVDDDYIGSLRNINIVDGLNPGFVTITATHKQNPQIISSYTIEVILPAPIVYAPSSVIQVNDQVQLGIINLEELNKTVDDFEWIISDETIISIDENYVVTATSTGSVTIDVILKDNDKVKQSYELLVTTLTTKRTHLNEPSQGPLIITASSPQAIVQAGDELEFLLAGANSLYNYRWRSSDNTTATATDDGRIIGIKAGIATIYVTSKTDSSIKGEIIVRVVGTPNINYAQRMVQIAESQVGYQQSPGNNTKYGDWFEFNYVAWCAIFVSWVANQAGVGTDVVHKFSLVSDGVRWFETRGLLELRDSDYEPKPGDIIFFQDNGRLSHTGIVIDYDGTRVYTVEGNTSNRVAYRSYDMTNTYVYGFGIPNYPEYTE